MAKRGVRIVEVGPRDGLQNEKQVIDTSVKVELVNRLQAAGCKYIEVGAFVSPKAVPRMADTGDVFKCSGVYIDIFKSLQKTRIEN